jgi:Ser/Thr protein kinase RdoA (MazF antagonist)
LRDALERTDDCADLPHALIHPDFVPSNVIAGPSGETVVVDWAGAGRGPRLWSLGFLLWAAGHRAMPCVDAVMAGYGAHVRLEPAEWERLAKAIGARPLIFAAWGFCTGRERLPDVTDGITSIETRAAAIAKRASRLRDDNSEITV